MLHAVIPAGGSGTRLWPLSRSSNPKFLHPLTGTAQTMLQATMARLAPLSGLSETFVVTGVSHAVAVARQLPDLPESNILVEPSPRDSCAAIGLAAAVIEHRSPGAVMGSFSADHLVRDPAAFVTVVREAVAGAERGLLMTVGITPTHPETGYGYLHTGDLVAGGIREVTEFKEKPNAEVARAYVESGNYLWNAGMFVWKTDVFLAELAEQQPSLHEGLRAIAAVWDTDDRDAAIGDLWPTLTKISVDYAVMEGASAKGIVGTVPGDFGWHDIGDFHTVGTVLPATDEGNVILGGSKDEVLLVDVHDSVIVPGSGRLVAAVGLRDVIIVDTPDAVLVCPRDRAQDVKKLVDELKDRGETAYL
ncbi:mannose-1-phosphate guanylyltransferase [Allocatelliglobosispora scoriae]|uniref:mannose-1-phosphate guanylyltransferase n=1 Tax=Allocatelliglobosispora scoriae TaxID=643052 RepID=A0A841BS98_9ACTN|nr:mannose-1-phosphate guanylyltransferase [Allocatelliglobosispora scoriae]MBB5870278.1 mannose-1-phosphate guanylyltransferase [Allocatelliglobosispora scoriae]